MTYLFVVAQLNMPTMTAPLSHGKQGPREEAHTSHALPATPPPTPQLLYSLRAIHYVRQRRGGSVDASSLPMPTNTSPTRSSARRQHPQTVQKWKYSQHGSVVPGPHTHQSCVLFAAYIRAQGRRQILSFSTSWLDPPVQIVLTNQGVY